MYHEKEIKFKQIKDRKTFCDECKFSEFKDIYNSHRFICVCKRTIPMIMDNLSRVFGSCGFFEKKE